MPMVSTAAVYIIQPLKWEFILYEGNNPMAE